jgi:hypothetical protein
MLGRIPFGAGHRFVSPTFRARIEVCLAFVKCERRAVRARSTAAAERSLEDSRSSCVLQDADRREKGCDHIKIDEQCVVARALRRQGHRG